MFNFFLFLALVFLHIFLLGNLFEYFRIPGIFAGLFVGILLSSLELFSIHLESSSFLFLSQLGMYFLLFIIGFEINFIQILKQGRSILGSTFAVIFFEVLFGSLALYFLFDLSWMISVIVASSFATVGEAMLLPLLEEFKMSSTPLGQRILGIGVLDDIFEIIVIIVVSLLLGQSIEAPQGHLFFGLGILCFLCLIVLLLFKYHDKLRHFHYTNINSLFIFLLFFLFLFLGLGEGVEAASLCAILAGVSLRNFIPAPKLKVIESEIKTLSYGFLAPLFFVWVGASIQFPLLFSQLHLVFLFVFIGLGAKILASFLTTQGFSVQKTLFLGVALSVKFSTGIVVLTLLFNSGIITEALFSVLIGSSIIFTLFIPLLLAFMAKRMSLSY